MWVVGIAFIAFLMIFAWRAAVLNGFAIFSLDTLKEIAPWLVGAAVLIVARELIERMRRKRKQP